MIIITPYSTTLRTVGYDTLLTLIKVGCRLDQRSAIIKQILQHLVRTVQNSRHVFIAQVYTLDTEKQYYSVKIQSLNAVIAESEDRDKNNILESIQNIYL